MFVFLSVQRNGTRCRFLFSVYLFGNGIKWRFGVCKNTLIVCAHKIFYLFLFPVFAHTQKLYFEKNLSGKILSGVIFDA